MDFRKSTSTRSFKRIFLILVTSIQIVFFNVHAQYTKLVDFGSTLNGTNPYGSLITDGTFLYGMTYDGGATDSGIIYKIKTDGSGFTKLLDFDGFNTGNGPYGSLFYDGTFLYGMTTYGGANGQGTIFKLKPDGSSFTKLLDFSYSANGAYPFGSLISDGTFLYGMASQGGTVGNGTAFKIKTDGTAFAKLHDFDNTSGNYPTGSLYSDGTFLYGMASAGGSNGVGVIFKVMPDGTNFSKLIDFNSSFGQYPYGSLISDGTFLYGTTSRGGTNGLGTMFKVMPDGSSFGKILDFNNTSPGGTPKGSLAYDGTFLYCTTADYGANSNGTIFKIKTDGSGFISLLDNDIANSNTYADGTMVIIGTTLYGVKVGGGGSGSPPFLPGTIFKINTDGSNYSKLFYFEIEGSHPNGTLFYDGSYMYGMTYNGGLYNYGTIFKVKPDGSNYTKLLDLDGANSGLNPNGYLISDGTYLYGMTSQGGANNFGIIFKIKPDGTGFIKLFDFDLTTNGGYPYASLFYDGTFLYGMTPQGGAQGTGVLFKIKPDGSNFTKLLDFTLSTNGGYPNGSLSSDGTFLYGTTSSGGANSLGTIFKIKPDGSGFVNLLDLDGTNIGSQPQGDLYYDGTFLYALTYYGGVNNAGVIMKIKTDGTGATKLLDLDQVNTGSNPTGSLISDGTYLYGMADAGGFKGWGTVFKIKPDGSNYTKLFDFIDGSYPQGSLLKIGSFVYGMTDGGGAKNSGILFRSSLTPFTTVTGFTPGNGVVGSYVTITGTNFDPTPANNIVKFNGVTAVVKSSTANSIIVVVPNGATTGPIAITSNGTTGTSITDFTVTTQTEMSDGTIQTCNVGFDSPSDANDHVETFVPVNSSDKIKVSFSSFSAGDILNVYDGPTTSSPKLASLTGNSLPADITATGSGGELTFEFLWQDSFSTTWQATISCISTGTPPVIATQTLSTQIGGKITLDLKPLITTPNLDLSSLEVITPPASGAPASIDGNGILTIDYTGKSFSGTEQITIQACDLNGQCATQDFSIDVVGDLIVYNAVSPNGKNPSLVIENIDVLPDAKINTVYIFDRWENQVWHGSNYDNSSVVFTGTSDGGSALPSGVYFYKIEFASGRKTKTGFISLRRQ